MSEWMGDLGPMIDPPNMERVREWFARFFYALNMWSMGYEFKRAWWFWDCEIGRMLRKRDTR